MSSFSAFRASAPASPKWTFRPTPWGGLLGTLAARMPGLAELIVVDRLHPSLAANLNGDRFISDPETPLGDDDCVLILSADAGG